MPIYDELYAREELRHILVRHEQAAVHAAEVLYNGPTSSLHGNPGPGATNFITGLATR